MTILVTGGAGYIGSHTCLELIAAGHSVVIYDSFINSDPGVLDRIAAITGVSPTVVNGDVRDQNKLAEVLKTYRCTSAIHFAGLKSVADSVADPTTYYDTNVAGTLALIKAMQCTGVNRLVFSSSATVYGEPDRLPLQEDHRLSPLSPYGRTKKAAEEMISDAASSATPIKAAILRYFNPVGSHESGLMGEDPYGTPNNIMPFISQVAIGRRQFLNVYGHDYDTPDGTGIRDYLHVMDLAAGHLRALESLQRRNLIKVNLGTGRGTSVLELVRAFEDASGQKIPIRFAPRRDGDIASYYASPRLALSFLNWRAKYSLQTMCSDAWRWQVRNPHGYRTGQVLNMDQKFGNAANTAAIPRAQGAA